MNTIRFRGFATFATAFATVLLTLSLLPRATSASAEVETTVVVTPGAPSAIFMLPAYMRVDQTSDALHGELSELSDSLIYHPGPSFWSAGADITWVSFTSLRSQKTTTFRIRWVVGETAHDGTRISTQDPGTGAWRRWDLYQSPNHQIEIVDGVVAAEAYRFTAVDESSDPSTLTAIGDVFLGQTTQTSSTVQMGAATDDLDPLAFESTGGLTILHWLDGSQMVADLVITASGGSSGLINPSGILKAKLISPSQETIGVDLAPGYNQFRLVRYTMNTGSGIQFFLNDILMDTIEAPPHIANQPEIHQVVATGTTIPSTNITVDIEDPTVRRSEQVADPTQRWIFDGFPSGQPNSNWSLVSRPAAQSFSPQDLLGSGKRLDIDLDILRVNQSSYLAKDLTMTTTISNSPTRRPNNGLQFWLDPSAVNLPQGEHFTLVAGCPASGPCGALRVRLGRDAMGFYLAATARADNGQVAEVLAAISNEPHVVEVRLKNAAAPDISNGWVELWIDGVLAGRERRLANHGQYPTLLRIGALAKSAGAGGIVGFDDIEAWSFR